MHRIIEWFIRNPVASNLLMMVLIVSGTLTLPRLYQEEFPSIQIDMVTVNVPYLGAAPTEVETAVCVRIEEAIDGTEGIHRVRSTASQGNCSVSVELLPNLDLTRITNDIKSKVDAIDSFPAETERPITSEVVLTAKVLEIVVSGDADERTLKLIGQRLRDEIAALPGISQVELTFARTYEITVAVSEQTLRRYGLTLEAVGQAIEKSSLDIPGGSLRTESGEILLRTIGQAYTGRDFEDIIILTRIDGSSVTLGEIATVIDGFKQSDLAARFNNRPAVQVVVYKTGHEDTLRVADQVQAYVAKVRNTVPEGIDIAVWKDESLKLKGRLEALAKNARSGFLLVALVLTLFLRFRLALWVAAGLPVALLGTVAMFPAAGVSINTLSIMGFLLVLGILVDDAIVVGERIFAHEQQGKTSVQAALDGTGEVSTPVIFGVLTTMATFIPLIAISGSMGKFFSALGITVIIALAFSVIESQLILPGHLAHRRPEKQRKSASGWMTRWLTLQDFLSTSLQNVASRYYRPAVDWALRWRYLTLAMGTVVLMITLSLFLSGRVLLQFFPSIDGDYLYATITLPEGTPVEKTAEAVAQLERSAEQLRRELDAQLTAGEGSSIPHMLSSIGAFQSKGSVGEGTRAARSNMAEIGLELKLPAALKNTPSRLIVDRWRELSGSIPDAVELSFTADSFSAGNALEFELHSADFDQLRSAAAELRNALQGYPGVFDASDSFRAGKQEIQLTLLPEARNLGLTLTDLGQQVRQAFYGYEAQRIQRGRDDIRVMVRYPEDERRSLGDLEAMRIRTASGTEIPFSSVARATMARGYTTINRVNGQRVVTVTGGVNRDISAPETIIDTVVANELAEILRRHPGVSYHLGGESEQSREAISSLISNILLALLLVYALLAIPLKSYLQPLVIMSVIPFGAVGAILGHFLLGHNLVFFSLLGIVALSGVVVNSSLVLVDSINRERDQGTPLLKVVAASGQQRFRPIVLTAATTFVGLLPLILSTDLSTLMFVPMAISLAFGVIFGTVTTLIMVPCLYLVLEDLLRFRRARSARATA